MWVPPRGALTSFSAVVSLAEAPSSRHHLAMTVLRVGILALAAAAAGASIVFAAGWRPPASGSWQCFRTDLFPDPVATRGPTFAPNWTPAMAENDHDATVFAVGLNQIAQNSAPGTVVTVRSLICVKY
jgi:hypothetical protein